MSCFAMHRAATGRGVVLVAVAGLAIAARGEQTSWSAPVSGDWTDAALWTAGVPWPGAGLDVRIAAGGAAYTSRVNGVFGVGNLFLDAGEATLELASGGVLNLSGVADLSAGTLRFTSGRINGGTLRIAEGVITEFSSSSQNILNGVAVEGDLALTGGNSTLRLLGGSTIDGTVTMTGSGARLAFDGDHTFGGRVVQSGSGTANITIENDAVLTLAAGAEVSGRRIDLGSAQFVNGDRFLVNLGTVAATEADATGVRIRSLNGLTNGGLLLASNGGRLEVGSTVDSFLNEGEVRAAEGSTVTINAASWSNTGTLAVDGGTLNLGGAFTTAGLGTLVRSGGSVNLVGTMDNTGASFGLDALTGPWHLSGGTIRGGTLALADDSLLTFSSSGNNILDGVFVEGDLRLAGAQSTVRLRNGTSVSGTVSLTGTNTRLAFEGTQTFTGDVRQSGSSTGNITVEGNSTLTLSETTSVSGRRIDLGSAQFIGGDRFLVNLGTITATEADATGIRIRSLNGLTNGGLLAASAAGSRLQIENTVRVFENLGAIVAEDGAVVTINAEAWSNAGVISVQGGTLNLGGGFTTAGLGTLERSGGEVNLTGRLDNSGDTLALNASTGPWTLVGGTIRGGVLTLADPSLLTFTSNSGNVLDGVHVLGDLVLGGSQSTVRLRNGTSVSGTVSLTGTNTRLAFEGTQTFTGDVRQSGSSTGNITVEGNSTLTLSETTSVSGRRIDLGSAQFVGGERHLVNLGEIRAVDADATGVRITSLDSFTIGAGGLFAAEVEGSAISVLASVSSFTNHGDVSGVAGSSVTIAAASWTNAAGGTISTDGGTLTLGGSWSNAGVISMTDGTLTLGGSFTTDGMGDLRRTGGQVRLTGTLDNTGRTLTFSEANTGPWLLAGGTIRGGVLALPDEALAVGDSTSNVLDAVQVAGDLVLSRQNATVRLRDGASVSGTIRLLGDNARLGFEGSQTFTGTVVQQGGASSTVSVEGDGTVLTIGDGASITARRATIGTAFAVGGERTLVNRGTITADGADTTGVRITSVGTLTNEGVFAATNGGRLRVADVGLFTNLSEGVLTGGAYRVGAGSRMDLGQPIRTNRAAIELLGPGADFAGLTTLGLNAGTLALRGGSALDIVASLGNDGLLAIGGESVLTIAGDFLLGESSVFRLAIGGAGADVRGPLVSVAGAAELGGELVLDLTGYSTAGLDGPVTFTFLDAGAFLGGFGSTTVLGLDPADVIVGVGTITIIPAPGALGLLAGAGLLAARRRR